MNLAVNDKVKFSPIGHFYQMGDRALMGVTTLMKKHGLSPDYSDVPPDVLKKAAERGTAVHRMLEDYDNGVEVVDNPTIAAYRKLGLDVVCSEYLVSDNETVASSIDKVVAVDGSTVDLGDVKTTSTLHKDSVSWQLSIYKYLFQLQNPSVRVRGLFAVHVRNGKVQRVDLPEVPQSEVARLIECERDGGIFLPETRSIDYDASRLLAGTLRIAELKASIKALEDANKEETEKLMDYMVKNHLSKFETDGGTFSIKDAYTRDSVDSGALKEKEPEIYAKFLKTSTVKASLVFKSK